MGGFDGLFGAIGELLGGLAGAGGEGAGEAIAGGVVEAVTDKDEAGADATFERYLAGAPRVLNINDR